MIQSAQEYFQSTSNPLSQSTYAGDDYIGLESANMTVPETCEVCGMKIQGVGAGKVRYYCGSVVVL